MLMRVRVYQSISTRYAAAAARLYVWSDLLQDDCMWKRKNNLYKSWNDI